MQQIKSKLNNGFYTFVKEGIDERGPYSEYKEQDGDIFRLYENMPMEYWEQVEKEKRKAQWRR